MNAELLRQMQREVPNVMEEAIQTRRYLHMHPEIGFETSNTEQLVRRRLEEIGVELLPADMGVIGRLEGQDREHIVVLRADMDALPIQEENDVPYRSTCPGRMHACGHDGHTAMLLAAARLLKAHQADLPVDVIVLFQPGEETHPGGAKFMLEDLRKQKLADRVVSCFGLHLFNDFPLGTICVKPGSMAASTDEFDITILGRGGHAGQPHKCVDALSVGTKIITAMESYMSRSMDPFDQAVFSVGLFHAGTAKNVVAETAQFAGTIRCQREETRANILEHMEQITKGICQAFGASCDVKITRGLPVLVNARSAVDYSASVIEQLMGKESLLYLDTPMMGAEDFAYLAQAFPSSFIWIGSGNPEKGFTHLAHQPKFDFDENAMANGIQILCGLALSQQAPDVK